MIKKIIMDGIKGQTGVQELTGRDIIVGRNGAGKTTRLQAMSLAAIGYVPEKGKTAADTFELASGDEMTVGIETEDFEVRREYDKTSKLTSDGTMDVKISQNIFISPSQGESTLKQKEQRVKEELGDFPTMLDFASFIELTDNKKRDFIYSLSGNALSWNREQVDNYLRGKLLSGQLSAVNPEMFDIMTKDVEDTIKQYKEKADVQSGILAMMEYAKDRLSYWKKEKQNSDAAARKLTELKNRGEETDRDLAENQDKLKALQVDHETQIKALAQIQAQNKARADRQNDLTTLQAEIDSISEPTNQEQIEAWKAEAESTRREAETCAATIAEIENALPEMSKELERLAEQIVSGNNHLTKKQGEKNEYQAIIRANTGLLDKITANAGCCAFSDKIPCQQDFSEFINNTNAEIDAAYEAIDTLTEELKAAGDRVKQNRLNYDSLKTEISQKQNIIKTANAELKTATEKAQELQALINQSENSAPTLAAKQARADEIRAWLDENPEAGEEEAKEAIEALKSKIEALMQIIDEQKKIRNDIVNIKANIIDSKTATIEVECWSQIAEAIGQKGIQGEIVKEMLDPLRELIDSKLEQMDLNARFYFETTSDRGKEIFRFGWIDKHGEKRPFNALSQGEQMLLLIALMTTIIEKRNPAVKILAIDNIDSLDKINMQKVIKGVLTAGTVMDNIILCGVADLTERDAPGWKVWRVE